MPDPASRRWRDSSRAPARSASRCSARIRREGRALRQVGVAMAVSSAHRPEARRAGSRESRQARPTDAAVAAVVHRRGLQHHAREVHAGGFEQVGEDGAARPAVRLAVEELGRRARPFTRRSASRNRGTTRASRPRSRRSVRVGRDRFREDRCRPHRRRRGRVRSSSVSSLSTSGNGVGGSDAGAPVARRWGRTSPGAARRWPSRGRRCRKT